MSISIPFLSSSAAEGLPDSVQRDARWHARTVSGVTDFVCRPQTLATVKKSCAQKNMDKQFTNGYSHHNRITYLIGEQPCWFSVILHKKISKLRNSISLDSDNLVNDYKDKLRIFQLQGPDRCDVVRSSGGTDACSDSFVRLGQNMNTLTCCAYKLNN